jgi:hypothetical protein
MPVLKPRHETIQSDITYQLRSLMDDEAVEIIARVMAHIVSRDYLRFPQLTTLFREAFTAENNYLLQQRTREGSPQ